MQPKAPTTISPEVELVIAADNHVGETPIWSPAEQALYWVNCENPPALFRYHPQSKDLKRWPMPDRTGGFALKQSGGLLIGLATGLYDFDPQTAKLTQRVASPLPAHVKLHESGCDRAGRFWIGGYDYSYNNKTNPNAADAAFLRLDGDRLTPVVTGIRVANGLAFSPDGTTMYQGDSTGPAIQAWTMNPKTGALSEPREFIRLQPGMGYVDGATVDSEGGYWLAVVMGSALHRYTPDGVLDIIVKLPFANPTKPTFGGRDLDILYITTTQLAVPPGTPGASMHGGLYALRTGKHGLPEPMLRA